MQLLQNTFKQHKINTIVNRKKFVLGLAVLCTATGWAVAQKVNIDAEFRPRGEYRQGYKKPLADSLKAALVTQQRTRIGFNFENSYLKARVSLQASSVFGENTVKEATVAGINEAWADLLLLPGFSAKIGRQGVQYEDGRIFSMANWSNTGNFHDLAMLKYNSTLFSGDLGLAYGNKSAVSQESAYLSNPDMYQTMAFLHLEKSFSGGLKATLLGVDEGFQKGTDNAGIQKRNYRYTTGGTLALNNDSVPVNFLLSGYYQFGKGVMPGKTEFNDLEAYFLSLKVSYTISKPFALTAGIDYFSGTVTDNIAGKKVNTFNRFSFSGNHTFNGYMDYWSALPDGGLLNPYGGANWNISKKLSFSAIYYAFFLAEDMTVNGSAVDGNIGSEVDLTLKYKLNPETAVEFGWSGYFTTQGYDQLKKLAGTNMLFPQYAYLMFTVKPKLFTQK